MSNKFLGESSVPLNSGNQEILGSTIGAVNLLSGTTVKVNSQHQLTSSKILITDVQGLSTAISGKLANPSSVPLVAPSFVKSGGTSSQYLMADGTVTTGGIGATGPTGANGSDGLSSSVFVYTFTTQTSGTPANGVVFLNDAPVGATQLYVNHLAKNGNDLDLILLNVSVNSKLIVQRSNNSNIFAKYTVTSITAFTGYVRYGLEYVENTGTIGNNNEVLLIVQQAGPAGPAGANAVNPNFTASVTSSGTDVTPAVTLTGTYPNLNLGFALRNGATGATGASGGGGGGGGNSTVTSFYFHISNSVDTTFYTDDKISFSWDETNNYLRANMIVAPAGSTDMRCLAQMFGGASYTIGRNTAIVNVGTSYQISDSINASLRCEAFVCADNDITYPAYHILAYNLGESFNNVIWLQKIHPN